MIIEIKKGDPKRLLGRLIAYVYISEEVNNPENSLHQFVRNGILSVQADFIKQRSIKDFFREEFGLPLDKGIEEIIDQAKLTGGLEGALDPEAVKERLESLKNSDFIPIPAKVGQYQSLEEMFDQDADVYYLGQYRSINNAHLSVNAFPILYQARFREQEQESFENEVGSLLRTIENSTEQSVKGSEKFEGNIKSFLLKSLIPKMIYNQSNSEEHSQALVQFREFMTDFASVADTEEIISLIDSNLKSDEGRLKRLELLVEKVEALQREDFVELERIKQELNKK